MGTGVFGSFFGFPAVGVGAGVGVAEEAGEEWEHCVEDAGVGGGCGLHVEVDGTGAFVHYCSLFEDSCRGECQWQFLQKL